MTPKRDLEGIHFTVLKDKQEQTEEIYMKISGNCKSDTQNNDLISQEKQLTEMKLHHSSGCNNTLMLKTSKGQFGLFLLDL